MSTTTPRPPRTTPNLQLPVPGDAGPADYVTDTGAICDRLDLVVAPIAAIPKARVSWAGTFNLPNGSYAGPTSGFIVNFDDGALQPMADTTGRITAPRAGLYLIEAMAQIAPNATNGRAVGVALNGANTWGELIGNAGASTNTQVRMTTMRILNAGDYLNVRGYQNSGVGLNLANAELTVAWLGA